MIGKLGAENKRHVGKHSFVNRTIHLWNQLPAHAIGTIYCKPSHFRKKLRQMIHLVKCFLFSKIKKLDSLPSILGLISKSGVQSNAAYQPSLVQLSLTAYVLRLRL